MFCSVQQIQEVPDDPQALENGYLIPFTHPDQGEITIPGYPVQFSNCQAGTRSAAPKLGEHTDLVLQNLGYSEHEIEKLKKGDVIQ